MRVRWKVGERHRDQQQRRRPEAERRRISRRIVRVYSIRSSHVGSLDAQLKVRQSASLTFDIESGCAVKRRTVHAQYSTEAFWRWPPWRTSNDFDNASRGGAPHARGGFKSAPSSGSKHGPGPVEPRRYHRHHHRSAGRHRAGRRGHRDESGDRSANLRQVELGRHLSARKFAPRHVYRLGRASRFQQIRPSRHYCGRRTAAGARSRTQVGYDAGSGHGHCRSAADPGPYLHR